jgi:hypothetical protein
MEPDEPTLSHRHLAGRQCGTMIYWGTLAGALLVILGSFVSMVMGHNLMNVEAQFDALWQGQNLAAIKQAGGMDSSHRHWYLPPSWRGDTLIMLGLVTGILSTIPGLLRAALTLWHSHDRLFAWGGLITAGLIAAAALGLLQTPL